MARKYTHIKVLEKEIFKMKAAGYTRREIAEKFNLSVNQVKSLINRHNRANAKIEAGIAPQTKGRPRKNTSITEKEKDSEIKRLKMENELLRDFLHLAGRK